MGNQRSRRRKPLWYNEIVELDAENNVDDVKLILELSIAVEKSALRDIGPLVDRLVRIDLNTYGNTTPLGQVDLIYEVSDGYFDNLLARLVFLDDYRSYRRVYDWWTTKRHPDFTAQRRREGYWSDVVEIVESEAFRLRGKSRFDSLFLVSARAIDAFLKDYGQRNLRPKTRWDVAKDILDCLVDRLQLAFQLRFDKVVADIGNVKGNMKIIARLREDLGTLENVFRKNARSGMADWAGMQAYETSEFRQIGRYKYYIDYYSGMSRRKSNALMYFYYGEDEPVLEGSRKERLQDELSQRHRQVLFFEFLYGIKPPPGVLIDLPYAELWDLQDALPKIVKRLGRRRALHSDETWIALLTAAHPTFVNSAFDEIDRILKSDRESGEVSEKELADFLGQAAPTARGKAWLNTLILLQWYFDIFAEHSRFDIRDGGTSYLRTDYPATRVGRLLHDCGVYAVRIAYIVGRSVAGMNKATRKRPGELDVTGSYVLLPYHVGLLLKTSSEAACIVNNGAMDLFPASKVHALQTRWTLTDDDGKTLDKADAKPLDEARFWGDLSASKYIGKADMPFIAAAIRGLTGGRSRVADSVWKTYRSKVIPTNEQLFDKRFLKPTAETFDIADAYLQLLQLRKEWHNEFVVEFWNRQAIKIWLSRKQALEAAMAKVVELGKRLDELDRQAAKAKTSRRKEQINAMLERTNLKRTEAWTEMVTLKQRYLDSLMDGENYGKGLEGVERGLKSFDALAGQVARFLDQNPQSINPKATRTRTAKVNEIGGKIGQVLAHIQEVFLLGLDAEAFPIPPFWGEEARIDRIPE